MGFYYRLFGLDVLSDVALPGVRARTWLPQENAAPVNIRLSGYSKDQIAPAPEQGILVFESKKNDPCVRIDYFPSTRFYRFLYGDGITFEIGSGGENVRGTWPSNMSLEDALTYLLGPVFGFVLRIRGFTALHASAAVINGYAVAFVGGGGAGKSTIVAALARAGHRILSDDIAVLEETSGTFRIKPSYPHIRLWPDSVSVLFGAKDALPKLVPSSDWWHKCFLDLERDGFYFHGEALPVRFTYILEPRSQDVRIARADVIPSLEAFPRLAANTCVNYALSPEMRRREFHALGRFVDQVIIKRLILGTSPECFEMLGSFLEQDAS
jgi:hypothetical protein